MEFSIIELKEFLESTPPGKTVLINEQALVMLTKGAPSYYIPMPTIQLHCSTKDCKGYPAGVFRCRERHAPNPSIASPSNSPLYGSGTAEATNGCMARLLIT